MNKAFQHLVRISRTRWCAITTLLSALVLVPAVVRAQAPSTSHFQVLYAFSGGNGAGATSGVILDRKGNIYGTTLQGGDLNCPDNPGLGCGVVYEISPNGQEKVLHKFNGQDGLTPVVIGDLTRDSQGNLYGVTLGGGDNSCACGNIFKIDTTGHETTLYTFTGVNSGDGAYPYAGLIVDGKGSLYGTTFKGGDNSCDSGYGCGTVFRFDLKTSKEKVLYTFGSNGGDDGQNPYGPLVEDAVGNLYGATSSGGGATACGGGCGTVFMLDPKNHETILHAFTGVNGDGAEPLPALILDKKGNLYGTTAYGGNNSGSGVVFTLTKTSKTWQETILHTFSGPDGAQPDGAVVFDTAGSLYGTAGAGGSFGYGTVYKLTPKDNKWALTVLHNFRDDKDGAEPWGGGLAIDGTGGLYGTAGYGGDLTCQSAQGPGCGVVFKITQ
jgi:uncharacterized repeat protein (TIGR03803 family)